MFNVGDTVRILNIPLNQDESNILASPNLTVKNGVYTIHNKVNQLVALQRERKIDICLSN